jgi:hypothetical protein
VESISDVSGKDVNMLGEEGGEYGRV